MYKLTTVTTYITCKKNKYLLCKRQYSIHEKLYTLCNFFNYLLSGQFKCSFHTTNVNEMSYSWYGWSGCDIYILNVYFNGCTRVKYVMMCYTNIKVGE